jgi:hypothetical protein
MPCPISSWFIPSLVTLGVLSPSLLLGPIAIPNYYSVPTYLLYYALFSQPANSQTACLLDFQPNPFLFNPYCPSQYSIAIRPRFSTTQGSSRFPFRKTRLVSFFCSDLKFPRPFCLYWFHSRPSCCYGAIARRHPVYHTQTNSTFDNRGCFAVHNCCVLSLVITSSCVVPFSSNISTSNQLGAFSSVVNLQPTHIRSNYTNDPAQFRIQKFVA